MQGADSAKSMPYPSASVRGIDAMGYFTTPSTRVPEKKEASKTEGTFKKVDEKIKPREEKPKTVESNKITISKENTREEKPKTVKEEKENVVDD